MSVTLRRACFFVFYRSAVAWRIKVRAADFQGGLCPQKSGFYRFTNLCETKYVKKKKAFLISSAIYEKNFKKFLFFILRNKKEKVPNIIKEKSLEGMKITN